MFIFFDKYLRQKEIHLVYVDYHDWYLWYIKN